MIKLSLKEWHHQHSQNLTSKIETVKNCISFLDEKGEESVLLDEELEELHDLSLNLHSLVRVQNSMNWQKSRMNWLPTGDANSKKIHGVMSSRRRQNSINMISIGR